MGLGGNGKRMIWEQGIVFGILTLTMCFFIWGRFRYDVVAVLALLAAVFLGVVPADHAFAGFGHPAVITVAAVLIISKALQISGMVDLIVDLLRPAGRSTLLQVGTTSGLGLAFSAFMNNIGALALMLPVALRQAARAGRPPSQILMPLSFGTLLGGLITLIGTPPNIIIATFRQEVTGEPFAMFDFTPVGLPVALAGLAFITFIGWRLLPHDRKGKHDANAEVRFAVERYLMESRVPDRSSLIGAQIRDLEILCENEMTVVALIRAGKSFLAPTAQDRVAARDILILEGDPNALAPLFGPGKLEHAVEESDFHSEQFVSEDVVMIEAVVMPGALVEGQSMRGLKLHQRFGINLLALARGDHKPQTRLGSIRFHRGDVLLLQGEREKLAGVLPTIGCLPLAERGFPAAGRQKRFPLALPIFLAAIVSAAVGLVSVPVAFVAAATRKSRTSSGFRARFGGLRAASSVPGSEWSAMRSVSVIGSPTATSLGLAITSKPNCPTAPSKDAGRLCTGGDSIAIGGWSTVAAMG